MSTFNWLDFARIDNRRHSRRASSYAVNGDNTDRIFISHGHANRRSDDFSSTAYWYQHEQHKPFTILPPEGRLPRADFPELKAPVQEENHDR